MGRLTVPELSDLLDGPAVPIYPYEKTFSEARHEPFVVLHTSGSTGLPKLVTPTNGTVASIDAFQRIPFEGGPPTVLSLFKRIRLFMPFPPFHAAGLYIMLPLAVFCEITIVLPPATPLTPEVADSAHIYGNVQGTILPASTLVDIAKSPTMLANLQILSFIAFGGAPLPPEIGNAIRTVSRPVNWLGATELCFTPLEIMDPDDWEYMKFSDVMGAQFRRIDDHLYELFIVRDEKLDPYQGIFCSFPHLQEYSMRDLYSKHPTKPDLWRYQGRADDIIVFTNGEKMNPLAMEELISSHEGVNSALLVGHGRFQSALLIEPTTPVRSEDDKQEALASIWRVVDLANRTCVAHGKVSKELILFTSPDKPMRRAGKGAVQRKPTLSAYRQEIDELYATADVNTAISGGMDMRNLETLSSSLGELVSHNASITLGRDHDFYSHGMDSLQTINLVRSINKALGREVVAAKTIYQNPTINDLAHVLLSALDFQPYRKDKGESTRRRSKMEDIFGTFSFDLPITTRPPLPTYDDRMHLLLTGSTGSLGSYLLAELLNDPKVGKVYCLNRSSNAGEKQEKSFREKGLSTTSFANKVHFIQCDLSRSYLGVGISNYLLLSQQITHILHNAWAVDFNLGIDSFVEAHIKGIRQLIDFSARSRKGAFIFFISSQGTVARWNLKNSGPVPEQIIADWGISEDMGYAESKLVSERLLDRAASVAGISSAVCRVGQIAGPTTQRGLWNRKEWLPSIIASSKYLGTVPDSLGPFVVDWIPVDILARIIVELLRPSMPGQDANTGMDERRKGTIKVFHAVNPSAMSWKELLPTIQQCIGTPLDVRPFNEWVQALEESASRRLDEIEIDTGLKLLDFYKDIQASTEFPRLETVKTVSESQTMATMGPVTVTWMRNWMRQWCF
jgi:thioester reductase-like protein